MFTKTQEEAPSVVSWNIYNNPGTSVVSASHCQDGQGGFIYNIETVDVNFVDNSKKKKNLRHPHPKNPKAPHPKNPKAPKQYKETQNTKEEIKKYVKNIYNKEVILCKNSALIYK
jgi:hypothetical protein